MGSVLWVLICTVLFLFVHPETSASDPANINVKFNQSTYYINENDKAVSLTVVLSEPLNLTNVTVYIEDESDDSGGDNFTNITVPAKYISETKSVSVTKDTLPSFTITKLCLSFTNATGPSDADECSDSDTDSVTGPDGPKATNVTVTVGEDKQTTVEYYTKLMFSESKYSVKENNGLANITLILSKPLPSSLNLTIISAALTRTLNDKDYDHGPFDVTFPANQTSVSFDISLNDDNVVEKDEKFLLTFRNTDLPDGLKLLGPSCEVTIIDTTIAVNFNQSQYRFKEGIKLAQLVLTINKEQSTTFAVSVKITPTSATDDDFNCTIHTVNFPINATSATLNITLIDDTVYEGNESFTVTIDSSSKLPPGVTVGVTSEATVIIVDDDVITVHFNKSMYNVNESDGIVQTILILSSPPAVDVTVHVLGIDGSAVHDITGSATDHDDIDFGIDYEFEETHVVTFQKNTTKATLNITIIDDAVWELDENFTLTIDTSSLPSNVNVTETGNNTTVTILNDDVISVQFEQSTYSVNESDGIVQPVLLLSSPSAVDIIVHVFIADGSAVPEADYDLNTREVTFLRGTNETTLNITIIDDTQLDLNGNFTLSVNSSLLPSNVRIDDPSSTMVTILNDDFVTISFSEAKYIATEDKVEVVLVLNQSQDAELFTVNGSFTNVAEKEPQSFFAVFKKRQNASKLIPIEVTQNETITIDLNSLPDYVKVGELTTASIIATSIAPTEVAASVANPVASSSKASTTTTGTSATINPTPTTTTTPPPPGSSSGFRSFFYISIFLLLILVPATYVYYQNREKISKCLKGKKFKRRRNVRYHLLPTSVGEALGNSHKAN